jgi:hypothetical protein
MVTNERYLHFDNIDMDKPDISSRCSCCGQEFRAEPKPGERADDVLLRIRAQFEGHKCRVARVATLPS